MKLKKALPLRWLVFAVVLSFLVSTTVLSRYMTTVSGGDSAQVAKFSVSLEAGEATLAFNGTTEPDDYQDLPYTFTVNNDSEVALEYSVTVTFGAVPPAQLALWVDDVEQIQSCDGTAQSFTFDGFTLGAGEKMTHTLTLRVSYVDSNGDYDFTAYSGDSLTVTVTAAQAMG